MVLRMVCEYKPLVTTIFSYSHSLLQQPFLSGLLKIKVVKSQDNVLKNDTYVIGGIYIFDKGFPKRAETILFTSIFSFSRHVSSSGL